MTPQVAAFLRNLLVQQQINVGSPDLVEVATLAADALTQLDAIIEGHADG